MSEQRPEDKPDTGKSQPLWERLRFLVKERRHVQLGVVEEDLLAAALGLEYASHRLAAVRPECGTRPIPGLPFADLASAFPAAPAEGQTPRTQRVLDGIIRDHNDEESRYGPSAWAYLEDHARQLERELAECRIERDCEQARVRSLRSGAVSATTERERIMREALEWYADAGKWRTSDDLKTSEIRAGNAWDIAFVALGQCAAPLSTTTLSNPARGEPVLSPISELKPDDNADAGRSRGAGEESGGGNGRTRSDAVGASGAECSARTPGREANQVAQERVEGENPSARSAIGPRTDG